MYTRNQDIDTDRLIIDVVLSSKWINAWNDFDLMQPPSLAAQNLTFNKQPSMVCFVQLYSKRILSGADLKGRGK